MPDDAPRCIKCGSDSAPAAIGPLKESAAATTTPADATQDPRRINWLRIFAVVLSSKLFFIVSCTGSVILAGASYDGIESGVHGDKVRPLDQRLAIIAVVPIAEKPGATKIVQTSLQDLEKFKQDNPGLSFLLPQGRGELEGPSVSLIRTEYSVTADGPGRILVETHFHDDEHHVLGRYSATDREIKPLYTRFRHDFAAFMAAFAFGLPVAMVLALIGSFLNWRLKRHSGEATAAAPPQSRTRRVLGLVAQGCMWVLVFVVVVEFLMTIARR